MTLPRVTWHGIRARAKQRLQLAASGMTNDTKGLILGGLLARPNR
jgi:hypothetical protein